MSRTVATICTTLVRGIISPMKRQRQEITASIISKNLIPQPTAYTPYGDIKFYCPNKEALEYQRELLTREPDTIEWISNFNEGEIYWDVGANVGAYTLYAAKVTKATVLAFEPSAQTFSLLVKNIELNLLSNNVWPLCLALSDRSVLDALNLSHTYASSAFNILGGDVNCLGEKIDVSFRQMVTAFSIDNFVKLFDPPLPNHIKIDVDSTELQILEGAQELLKNEGVKSILVEAYLGSGYSDANEIKIKGLLENFGFKASFCKDNLKSGNIIFVR